MKNVRVDQEAHYRVLLEKHAGTPMAVSSESAAHKKLRFDQIAKVFGDDSRFSLHDVGMGLGAFGSYLRENFAERQIQYSGTEILSEFVEGARREHPESNFFHRDLAERPGDDRYDYITFSGVFHQRRSTPIPEWEKFSRLILRNAWAMCRKGLAFNFISPFVDFYQTEVYYANLARITQFVVEELSRFFVVNHSYALFEFSVLVYREDYIAERDSAPEFRKYFKELR
jgi:hypothetical protein